MGDGGENFYTEWEESYESFDQMGLHENLLRGIYAYGQSIYSSSWALLVCLKFILLG
jgi:hypothetical protein